MSRDSQFVAYIIGMYYDIALETDNFLRESQKSERSDFWTHFNSEIGTIPI